MEIQVLRDAGTVAEVAAEIIVKEARSAVSQRGRFTFAVSGGQTPWRMLRALAAKEMPWQDVSRMYIKYRHHGKTGSHYWFFENPDGKKLRFPLSFYSRSQLQSLAREVSRLRSSAIFDDRIAAMAEGRFPWYIF